MEQHTGNLTINSKNLMNKFALFLPVGQHEYGFDTSAQITFLLTDMVCNHYPEFWFYRSNHNRLNKLAAFFVIQVTIKRFVQKSL
jgi:hypothetical protein